MKREPGVKVPPSRAPPDVRPSGFLDWYRAGFLLRCAGLTAEQLAERAVPPSRLSLLGLVRHLTDVERNYFLRRYGGQEIASLYFRPDRPGVCFEDADLIRERIDGTTYS
jgi:hypothetical protein